MKNKYFYIFVFFATIPPSLLYLYYMDKNKLRHEGVNCYAQVQYDYVFPEHHDVIDTGLIFSLANGKGIISYSGNLTYGAQSYKIDRYAEVTYTLKNETSFLIRTKKLVVETYDNLPNELAKKYLYSYMRENQGWLNVSIHPSANGGYLFYTSPIPQFYCKKM
ncbi:hypothetical protein ACIQ2O_01940 [Serratia grimesii]|uniref:hypothetical protein n=1 Tax=Serratia grimesii TaxID=82995 RepID=UPI003839F385